MQDIGGFLFLGFFLWFFGSIFVENRGPWALTTGSTRDQRRTYLVSMGVLSLVLGLAGVGLGWAWGLLYIYGVLFFARIEDRLIEALLMATGAGLIFMFMGLVILGKNIGGSL